MHLSRESEGGGEIMFPLVGVTMFQLSVKGEQLLFPSPTLCPTSPHTYLRLQGSIRTLTCQDSDKDNVEVF